MITIIGAGLAGLVCAWELMAKGVTVRVLEASHTVGGRVRTDSYQGFLLDRGFQVLLTAYPECKRLLQYEALNLKSFYPGAMIYLNGKFHRFADPAKHIFDAVGSLKSPVGSFTDKLRVGALRTDVTSVPLETLFSRPETTTLAALQSRHFSQSMIDGFFRPFFGGIFLERELTTSSRLFEFLFRMFAEGDTVIPATGMQAIPQQLAAHLPIEFGVKVDTLDSLESDGVVIATEEPEAARLLGTELPKKWKSVQCHYFATDHSPTDEPILMLNGESRGPVNNFCVESNVAPLFAPPGAALLSATVLGNASENEVREHLAEWFGPQVQRWAFLRTYDINYAQPDQNPPALASPEKPVRVRQGVYRCGDYLENASLQGAMASGRRAAEAILQDRQ